MRSPEFYELVLERDVSSAELDQLIAWASAERRAGRGDGEGLFLDFKSATNLTGDNAARKKARTDWRRDLVAFANSAGGVLVIGVDEVGDTGLHVAGVPPGSGEASVWVTGMMQPVAHAVLLPPIVRTLRYGDADVWLIAMRRSPGPLIPIPSAAERWLYPLRTEAGTVDAPDYLVSDLLVGRREQPTFEVTARAHSSRNTAKSSSDQVLSVVYEVTLDNASMIYAGGVSLNLVNLHSPVEPDTSRARPLPASRPPFENRLVLSPALRRELDYVPGGLEFRHRVVNLGDMSAFAVTRVAFPPARYPGAAKLAWSAVIVTHRDGPAAMYQLRFDLPTEGWHEGQESFLPRVQRPRVAVE